MEAIFLKSRLDAMVEKYNSGCLDSDPVGIVHDLSHAEDIEVGALLASSLALGRASTIREKTRDLFGRLGGRPGAFVREAPDTRIAASLSGFRHRFYGEDDLASLLINIRRLLRERGSLAAAWRRDVVFESALDLFVTELMRPVAGRRTRASIPLAASPRQGSTCKRILMFLRWMVRPADGIDFGLWTSPRPSELVIPMDTHVFRVSRLLGLTRRRTPSWKAAVEVTAELRKLAPDDPVRYDFALSRVGIIEGCRARYIPSICGRCSLVEVCSVAKSGIARTVTRTRAAAAERVLHA